MTRSCHARDDPALRFLVQLAISRVSILVRPSAMLKILQHSEERPFYGWYVVCAIGLVLTTESGLAFYNLAVLLDAFIRERGFPVALASGATASYFLASGMGGVVAARVMERMDARVIMIGGACLSSVALGCIGLLRRPWELFAFHVVFGFCYGCCGLVPATTVVARWFEARRPLALSIASTGLSLGGIVVTPLAALLITRAGLAGAGPWLGLAFFLGVVPVTALIVRASPFHMGLEPDGARPGTRRAQRAAVGNVSFAVARRSRFFIGLTVAYVFTLGAQVGAIAHLFRLVSIRETGNAAMLAVAMMAAASVIGRLCGGWFLLRLPTRRFTLAMFAVQAAALVLLSIAPTQGTLFAGAVLLGASMGNVLMLQPLLLVEAFGLRDYGRIYSLSQLLTAIGVAGGPVLVGVINAATAGYTVPYLVAAGASLGGLALLLLSGRPQVAGCHS
jgi:MFS family permease